MYPHTEQVHFIILSSFDIDFNLLFCLFSYDICIIYQISKECKPFFKKNAHYLYTLPKGAVHGIMVAEDYRVQSPVVKEYIIEGIFDNKER